jgi:hypothetical protein
MIVTVHNPYDVVVTSVSFLSKSRQHGTLRSEFPHFRGLESMGMYNRMRNGTSFFEQGQNQFARDIKEALLCPLLDHLQHNDH